MISSLEYQKIHSDFTEELESHQRSVELFQTVTQQLTDDFQSLKLEIAGVPLPSSKAQSVSRAADVSALENTSVGAECSAHDSESDPIWASHVVAIVKRLHDAEESLRMSVRHLERLHSATELVRVRTVQEGGIAELERRRVAFISSAEEDRDCRIALRAAIYDYIQCVLPSHPMPAQELKEKLASPVFSTIAAAEAISDIALSQLKNSRLAETSGALLEARGNIERPQISRLSGENSLRDVLSQRGGRIGRTDGVAQESPNISRS